MCNFTTIGLSGVLVQNIFILNIYTKQTIDKDKSQNVHIMRVFFIFSVAFDLVTTEKILGRKKFHTAEYSNLNLSLTSI